MSDSQGFLLMDQAGYDDVMALRSDVEGVSNVLPLIINNAQADQLGYGTLNDGHHYVAPSRILLDPENSRYWDLCSQFPIYVMDPSTIFAPEDPG
jgi:hypothetical protein